MVDFSGLRRIAERARTWAENYQQAHPEDFFDERLGGMCAKAAYYLTHLCEQAGIPCYIYANQRHCFPVVYGKLIVDVTATQFGYADKVVIKQICKRKQDEKWYWQRELKIGTCKDAIRRLVYHKWCEEQLPNEAELT